MNLQQIQAWVARLTPMGQADIPTEIAGLIMTPNDLLRHAQANDNVWKQLQQKELK